MSNEHREIQDLIEQEIEDEMDPDYQQYIALCQKEA